MKGIHKGDLIDLPEHRVQVTSEPVVEDGHITFDVKTVPFTPCPVCGSRNTGQWVEDDHRFPAWLCSEPGCGTEWVDKSA